MITHKTADRASYKMIHGSTLEFRHFVLTLMDPVHSMRLIMKSDRPQFPWLEAP